MTRLRPHGPMVVGLVAFVLAMIGLAYASVPLYRMFCRATGYGGTTQRVAIADAKPGSEVERWVTVSFDGNVAAGLPWDFAPDVKSRRVKLGEVVEASYHAHNHGAKALVGSAVFNVQPDKAGAYFDKVQCFCFTSQTLQPGQTAELPVRFYVDSAMAADHDADDVGNITLSYTFFLAKDQGTP